MRNFLSKWWHVIALLVVGMSLLTLLFVDKITALKFIALIVTGISALFALLTDFRKDPSETSKKKLTGWGIIAIIFICCAGIINAYQLWSEKQKSDVEKIKSDEAANVAINKQEKAEKQTEEIANKLSSVTNKADETLLNLANSSNKQDKELENIRNVSDNLGNVSNSLVGIDKSQQDNLKKSSDIFDSQQAGLLKTIRSLEQVGKKQNDQVKLQGKTLDDLKSLYLAQYKLDELWISWTLSDDIRDKIIKDFNESVFKNSKKVGQTHHF